MEWMRKHQISRVQATKSSSEAEKDEQDLPVRKKSNASEGFNSAVKRKNVGAKSSRADETNQEAQKRLKAQRQWGASRRQCQRAEQTARRLLDQSEGNARRHENDKTTITMQPATKLLTQPATSSSETFYVLFVNSRFHFHLGIEPCQMRFKTFRSQVSWSFKIRATSDFNWPLVLLFSLAQWFPFLNHNILEARTICKHSSLFIHFVLNN